MGSLFYIVASPPGGSDFILFKTWLSASVDIKYQLMIPYYFTLGSVSVITAFAYAYKLGEEMKVDALHTAVLSGLSYMALCFPNWSDARFSFDAMSEVTGPNGILISILISILSAKFMKFIKVKGFLFSRKTGLSSLLSKGFEFLFPMALFISLMWALGWLSGNLLGQPLPSGIVEQLKGLIASCSNIGKDLLSSLSGSVLYMFGMDGGRINQPLYSVFMNPGGFGTLLPLVVFFLLSSSRHMKQIGKVSLIPAIFNVPYPLMYAAPLVMSPIYIIPFILCPIVTTSVNYLVISSGIVSVSSQTAGTMPVIMSGYFSTFGGLIGIALQVFNLVIAFVIYHPFYKYHETKILSQCGTQQEKKQAVERVSARAARLFSGMLGVNIKTISNGRKKNKGLPE